MNNFKNILGSPLFLASLFVLLLNDLFLKDLLGNWLTGKLSDVSGLIVFAFFFTACFPNRKKHVFLITALAFVFWKSAASQDFIDNWNHTFPFFIIHRIVDYTDLFCLLVLIPASRYRLNSIQISNYVIYPISILTVFAIAATSRARPFTSDVIRINNGFRVNYTPHDLMLFLSFSDYDHEIDSIPFIHGSDTLTQVHIRNIILKNDTIYELNIAIRPLRKKAYVFVRDIRFSSKVPDYTHLVSKTKYDEFAKEYTKLSEQYIEKLVKK